MNRPAYTLTWMELHNGASCGVVRRITGLKENYNKNKHADKSDWATDIDGANAEQVLAKHLNRYWEPTNRTFKKPDVGNDYQVRSTSYTYTSKRPDIACLIIRENDKDTGRPYVLVETHPPKYIICGWITPAEAKVEKYKRVDEKGRASWWVPQDDLHDIATLPLPSAKKEAA